MYVFHSRGRLSSEGSPHDVPVTSAIENVDGMAFHNRGRLSSDGSPQAAPVNSVPENVEVTQVTNILNDQKKIKISILIQKHITI